MNVTSNEAPGKALTKLIKRILKNYDRKIRPFYGGKELEIYAILMLRWRPAIARSTIHHGIVLEDGNKKVLKKYLRSLSEQNRSNSISDRSRFALRKVFILV